MLTISDHQLTRLNDHRVKASASLNLDGHAHPVSFIVEGDSLYRGLVAELRKLKRAR